MTNRTSQGLFVIIAVVIFGIFTLISYLIFQSSLKPKLTSIFDTSLLRSDNILKGFTFESLTLHNTKGNVLDYNISNNVLEYSATGQNNINAFYIPIGKIPSNTKFKLTYYLEVLEGEIGTIGGHSTQYDKTINEEDTDKRSKNVFINDVLQDGNYHYTIIYPFEKGNKYKIDVLLDSSDYSDLSTNPVNNSLFIQPNRLYGFLVAGETDNARRDVSEPYKVRLSGLQVEYL